MILDNFSSLLQFIKNNDEDLGIDSNHIAIFDAGGEVLITTEALAALDLELSKGIVYGLFFYGSIDEKIISTFPQHIETVFYSGELIKTLNDELDNVVNSLKERGSTSELFILQGRNYMFEYNNNDQEVEEILKKNDYYYEKCYPIIYKK